MNGAWIFSLTRQPDSVSGTPEALKDIGKQQTLVDDIRNSRVPGIPSFWADHVVLSISDPTTDGVSSSVARKLVKEKQNVSRVVSRRVEEYISRKGLYIS
jgi:nicotinic acid mononucleotide adenylyltransferase